MRRYPLALHLVDQPGEAVGQIIERGTRGEVRLPVQKL